VLLPVARVEASFFGVASNIFCDKDNGRSNIVFEVEWALGADSALVKASWCG